MLCKVWKSNISWLFKVLLLLSKTALQEVAGSFHFFLVVSVEALLCHPSHEMICLRATRELGWKAKDTWPKNILRPWLYSRKGLISLGAQNIWMSRVHETHVWDSSCLNRCLLDLTTTKLPRDILKVFERRRIFLTNFSTWQYF